MVLEIWAQETSNTTTDLKMNKNRRSIPLFINSNQETISLNESRNESFNSDVIENIQLVNNETATGFARDDVKSYNNISHLSSNGYYGYSRNIGGDNSYENNCASSGTVMDVDLNNSNLQFERRKRCFAVSDDMTTQSYQKKFKYGDEYENFHQTSFDPNGTSISFNNEINKDEIRNCSQIETEMMQTNEAEILQTKYPAEETNQFTLLKQKSFTEFNMKETQKIHKNNIKNKFDSNNSYSTCKYSEKNNCKKLKTNTENLLENLFLLTHGGSNYQMWQHYNINIDT